MLAISVALLPVLTVPVAHASEGPPLILHPETYLSPSGQMELHVDPSSRSGAGEGSYVLSRGGEVLWERRLPFTFWEAEVSNDGSIAGYAYSHGWRARKTSGDLILALVDPRGEVLVTERIERNQIIMHGPPGPMGWGVFVDQSSNRAVIQLSRGHPDEYEFRQWELSTGRRTGSFIPQVHPAEGILQHAGQAVPVRGTNLTLLFHWYANRSEFRNWRDGARYTLIDEAGKLVWDLVRERDFQRLELSPSEDDSVDPILSSADESRFALWFVAEAERVEFEVSQTESGQWSVAEISREAHPDPPRPVEVQPAALDAVTLDTLSTVRLGEAAAVESDVHDVRAFGFSEEGRLRVVCGDPKQHEQFTILHVDKAELDVFSKTEVRLPLGARKWCQWFPMSGGRWFAASGARSWWVDGHSGAVEAAAKGAGHDPIAVVPTSDGGHVFFGSREPESVSHQAILRFDSQRELLWSIEVTGDPRDPAALFSPEDVTVSSAGEVVVLDNLRNDLTYFSVADGSYLRTVDLVAALGAQPNYASGILADARGGMTFIDFDGDPPLWRLDAEGSAQASLTPSFADGSSVDELARNVRVSPGGELWTTDRKAIYRLNREGSVDRVLGQRPAADRLQEIGAIAVGPSGQIYVQDKSTFSVHIFDPAGVQSGLLTLSPSDVSSMEDSKHLAIDCDGKVAISCGEWDDNSYLLFSPEGERLEELSIEDDLFYMPHRPGAWLADYRDVHRLDGEHYLLKTLSRRSDRRWIRRAGDLDLSADGSLAVLDVDNSFGGYLGLHSAVATFDSQGEAREVYELPARLDAHRLAHTSRWIAVSGHSRGLLLIDKRDSSCRRVDLEIERFDFDFGPRDQELWIVERSLPPRLHRLALPED